MNQFGAGQGKVRHEITIKSPGYPGELPPSRSVHNFHASQTSGHGREQQASNNPHPPQLDDYPGKWENRTRHLLPHPHPPRFQIRANKLPYLTTTISHDFHPRNQESTQPNPTQLVFSHRKLNFFGSVRSAVLFDLSFASLSIAVSFA